MTDKKINSKLKLNVEQNNIISNTLKKINIPNKNIICKTNGKKEKNNNQSIINFTDNEINSFIYKDALNLDHRTFYQYYISLLKTKHLLIFSFYTNDYNSKIIKITIFLFSFDLLYTVNSLFFQDSTIHKLYEDNGEFDFIYQLPLILYSTIISSFITLIAKYLSLIENNIIEIKNTNNNTKELNRKIKQIKIKLFLFFPFIFLFSAIFWCYLYCFCAVYKNTQKLLLKDTLLSFGLSLIYPFILFVLPGFFRIPALKKETKGGNCLYRLSKIIQSLI